MVDKPDIMIEMKLETAEERDTVLFSERLRQLT